MPQSEFTLPLNLCICGSSDCGIPFGYCHCGTCGLKTKIAIETRVRYCTIAGIPQRYINGHSTASQRGEFQQPDSTDERYIYLTQERVTVIDVADFEVLAAFRYHFSGKYAKRMVRKFDGSGASYREAAWLQHDILPPPEGMVVDHINGDYLDNRRHNLRVCTPWENSQNKKLNARNTSGYAGVGWVDSRRRWIASIVYCERKIYLGLFLFKEDAVRARLIAEKRYFGEFARERA